MADWDTVVVGWDGLWEHWWRKVDTVVVLVLKHHMSKTLTNFVNHSALN